MNKEIQAHRGQMGIMGLPVLQDLPAQLAHRVLLDNQGLLVPLDSQDLLVIQDLGETLVLEEPQVVSVLSELQDLKDPLVQLETLVLLDQQDHKEILVIQVKWELQGLWGLLE